MNQLSCQEPNWIHLVQIPYKTQSRNTYAIEVDFRSHQERVRNGDPLTPVLPFQKSFRHRRRHGIQLEHGPESSLREVRRWLTGISNLNSRQSKHESLSLLSGADVIAESVKEGRRACFPKAQSREGYQPVGTRYIRVQHAARNVLLTLSQGRTAAPPPTHTHPGPARARPR